MTILKDKKVIISASTLTEFPKVDCELIDQEILETLYQVMHKIHPVSDTIPSILNNIFPNPIPPIVINFFNRCFPSLSTGVKPYIWIDCDTLGSKPVFSLVVNPLQKVQEESFVSFLYYVVIFHFSKQLKLISFGDTRPIINSFSSANTTIQQLQALKDDSNQPLIYQILKKVLIDHGFTDLLTLAPSRVTINDKVKFNKLFNPIIYLVNEVYTNGLINQLFIYMNDGSGFFNFKDKSINRKAISILNSSDRSKYLKVEYLKIIYSIFTDWNIQKSILINSYVNCLFKQIFPNKKSPDGKMLSSGDASSTLGIFNVNNYGVLLFNYQYFFNKSDINFPIKVGLKNRTVYSSPGKNKNVIVNLNVFGLNGYNSIIRVKINNIPEFQILFDIKNDFLNTIPLSLPNLDSLNFDTSSHNLSFISDGSDIVITTSSAGSDEILALTVVMESLSSNFSFELKNLFENDRFELTNTKRDSEFLKDVSNLDNHLLNIAKILSIYPSNFATKINLTGNFVGIKDTISKKVIKDKRYKLIRNLTDPLNFLIEEDDPIINETTDTPQQILDKQEKSASYADLRTSYGSVSYNDNKLEINISSFVSPLRSRLDKRLLGPNLNGQGGQNTIYHFEYRNQDRMIRAKDLNLHTYFGSDINSDKFLYNDEENPIDTEKIASYNQLLSALRSFGVLEALLDKIKIFATSWLSSNPDSGLDISNIELNIIAILNQARCNTIIDSNGNQKQIQYSDYFSWKWYESPSDKNLFSRTNSYEE